MIEPNEDLQCMLAQLGDLVQFDTFSLYAVSGQLATQVPDYHSIHDQTRVTLVLLCSTADALAHGILTSDYRQNATLLTQGLPFTVNGMAGELLTASPDTTGLTYLGCTYV